MKVNNVPWIIVYIQDSLFIYEGKIDFYDVLFEITE